MKSNGWSEVTAALQLFAHLDGEALNVALLMPVEEREKWEDLSNRLTEYYNSPRRLAVFRRQFESASRHPVDPATFATELGILAVRGFGDMGKRARDSMVRDKFIAAQRNCGLRRHLDGASSDAPIRDIVDSCRVWESHSEQESSSDAGRAGILWESPTSFGMSDVSGRSCRSFRRVREWAREFQCLWLVWIRGVRRLCGRWRKGIVSWLPWKPYPRW